MTIQEKFSLEGKVALVTGSTRGIGEAIAKALAQAGATVVVSSRKAEAVESTVESFKKEGLNAVGIPCNMGEMQSIDDLLKTMEDTLGGVDIIVNNAAANPYFGTVKDIPEWAFDKIMEVNVKGPFELCRKAYPIMKKRGGGSIINISSIGGVSPEQFLGIYNVSKAALISLTKVMAKEWGSAGIRANVICPGLIKTDFSKALWSNEKMVDLLTQHQPISRVGTVDEMAGLALFLASEASSYCTGAVYMADGGFTI